MRIRSAALSLLLLGLVALPAQTAEPEGARFTFVKIFPRSLPEYTALTLGEDGQANYDGRALAEPPHPETFRLPAEVAARVFTLVRELNYFQGLQLDTGRKVANLGEKTFRYEKGRQRAEVRFNYTENAAAASLQELCEKIARGRFHIAQLTFKLKYDRLGVLGALRDFEQQFNQGDFVSPDQFIPVLTQIAQDARLVRLAQSRAQRLLERIRGAPAQILFEQANEFEGWYIAIRLREDGQASYERRRLDQPSAWHPLRISESLHARAFALLQEANYLRDVRAYREPNKAASGVRLTYEAGTEYNQVAFSTPPAPSLGALARLFAQLLIQMDFRQRLEQALGPEPIELPLVLRDLEDALDQKALAEPAEFVPLLEKVAQGGNFFEQEQALARKILDKIRPTP